MIGTVTQVVDLNAREYVNNVELLGGIVKASLDATWENDAFGYDTKWTVIFRRLCFKIFGIKFMDKELSQEGFWRMSYLDEDVRVLWAKGGKNLTKENVYVLVKD